MNKKFKILWISACLITLSACKPGTPETASAPGADRDAHGCIPSAGYQWCGKENQCVRSWELAKEKGFENSEGSFHNYCRS